MKEGHWIKAANRTRNQKYICSECGFPCFCISYLGKVNGENISTCDYEYCPHCGSPMDSRYEALENARE